MSDAILLLDTGSGPRDVRIDPSRDRAADERATTDALAWIKALRHADVDGQPFRRRFTFRDDSLWWFAELYLHKQQVIAQVFRTIAALESLLARERPQALHFVRGSSILRGLAPQIAAAHGIAYRGPRGFGRRAAIRLAMMDARASVLHAAALASRLRTSPPAGRARARAVAFVHRAFWRSDSGEGSAEAYIGPVLAALEARLEPHALTYVSVGPASNFRARRWWHPLKGASHTDAPIEAYAPLRALAASQQIWRDRHVMRRALWKSADLRRRATIGGYDCWPIVREELAGIALLQWPWSARAMDEAAAALDALHPAVAVTYAEAGGWGRALALECRRRAIPFVGLQHGFIYRHWLNYLHEPDEMTADPEHPADRGFPRPDQTLLFDDYAGQHLAARGHYPAESLAVTGSPRLDALAAHLTTLTAETVEATRAAAGATATSTLVLVATKEREARGVLGALVDAAATIPHVHLAIKTHPAETPDVYATVAAGRPHVTVLDAAVPLAPLLEASRAVVTVNSTVALDAAVLGIPALVIGLPNNLTPFVDAGVLVGVGEPSRDGAPPADIARALRQILYDEEFRRELARTREAFLTRFRIAADGRAAARAAEALLQLAGGARR